MHVGTIEPRKDIEMLVAAFDRLAAEFADVDLVLIGREGWKADAITRQLRSHPEYGRRLRWVQGASDDVVARELSDAFCVVVASRYEGFGLPIAEALARGSVVVSTDGGALGEVAPGLVDLVPVADAGALATAVRRYLVDDTAWMARRHAIAAWAPPTWDDTASAIALVLRDVGSVQ